MHELLAFYFSSNQIFKCAIILGLLSISFKSFLNTLFVTWARKTEINIFRGDEENRQRGKSCFVVISARQLNSFVCRNASFQQQQACFAYSCSTFCFLFGLTTHLHETTAYACTNGHEFIILLFTASQVLFPLNSSLLSLLPLRQIANKRKKFCFSLFLLVFNSFAFIWKTCF